ncbi:Asparaginase superfamily [Aciduliprofundum boonei T469]|nr:Asparaginase superfamily [Aciduliprofundum boonei T469]
MNSLVLHGGASNKSELKMKVEEFADIAFKEKNALNAVVKAVVLMEDDPLFNAGTGSNMRLDGSIQMDAAVMVPGKFGAVVNIENVRNPVLVARDVMLKSPHLILAGDGAIEFARKMGYESYDPSTEKAREKRERILKKLKNGEIPEYYHPKFFLEFLGDTVGAVARINGDFAAAVSTGGTSLTLRGRVGDSPIPGAGIYCGEKGAVVATGIGEEIIKRMLSINVYNRIGEMPLEEICKEELERFGDIPVGIIAIDKDSECALSNLTMPYAIKKE